MREGAPSLGDCFEGLVIMETASPNDNIGHPKLFMVGEASAAISQAAADCE
jgi:hypothetical protein